MQLTNHDAALILSKLNFCSTGHELDCEELREILADCDPQAPVSDQDGSRVMDLVMAAYDA